MTGIFPFPLPGGPSAQGEHIFNALNALGLELATQLDGHVSASGSLESRHAATVAIGHLRTVAGQLAVARDNLEFRSAAAGSPINANRYSSTAQTVRDAVRNIATGSASMHTAGYTAMNRILNELPHYTVDATARASRRAALPGHRRAAFDLWFDQTNQLMEDTFVALRDAALAVARTRP